MAMLIRRAFAAWSCLFLAAGFLPPAAAEDSTTTVELSGVVQQMPASGLVGTWTIAGKTVRTDASTAIDQEEGTIGVGAMVEVKGVAQSDGSLLATKIEVKHGVGGPPPGTGSGAGPGTGTVGEHSGAGEFSGAIESLPTGTLIGTWHIAGHTVNVVSTTRLEQEHGGFAVGATVEVHGTVDSAGVLTASSIELKAGGASSPTPGTGEVQLMGTIDTLPVGGLVGNWQVAGRTIVVDASTALEAEHGTFAVGASVEVHGTEATGGQIAATRIELTKGMGAPVPGVKFWGHVVSLPTGTTGLIGIWKVDDRSVNVTAATKVQANDAPIVVGTIVEVDGWVQTDGVVEAEEIESRAAMGMVAGQGTVAVEFFNSQLGHYFLTAFPPEIAALDAGGVWLRTGQSFKVGGGTQAVCRFYGMPPRGPDSHFFTADGAECQHVMADFAAWTFEGYAFSITPPGSNGQCPAGLLPVHRFYNNPQQGDDMNHRYVVDAAIMAQMTAAGWIDEGVVMCVQP